MTPQTPAGWYPDSELGGLRYWDGLQWTEHRAPAAPAAPAGPGEIVPAGGAGTSAYPQAYPPVRQVAAKSPGIALLAAFFVPGLGSLMNGDVGKGIGIFVGYAVSWLLAVVLIGFFGIIGFWIWGMVDAYQGARRWNARHGILS